MMSAISTQASDFVTAKVAASSDRSGLWHSNFRSVHSPSLVPLLQSQLMRQGANTRARHAALIRSFGISADAYFCGLCVRASGRSRLIPAIFGRARRALAQSPGVCDAVRPTPPNVVVVDRRTDRLMCAIFDQPTSSCRVRRRHSIDEK